MIHEAGSPVPGAGRNSWHYLLQMGLKMLLARLTRALIYSSRRTERWGSFFQHRYEPPPPLHARTRTHTNPHVYSHPPTSVLTICASMVMYLEMRKKERELNLWHQTCNVNGVAYVLNMSSTRVSSFSTFIFLCQGLYIDMNLILDLKYKPLSEK